MMVGCPRTYDRDDIAEKMLAWVEKEDSINLCGFSFEVKIGPSILLKWSKEDDLFGMTYELVKAKLGQRREKLLSRDQLHVKAYDLNAKTYDAFLKDESRDEKAFESSLKAQELIAANEDDVKRHQETLDQLKLLRSDRNIDNNNINAEHKSA